MEYITETTDLAAAENPVVVLVEENKRLTDKIARSEESLSDALARERAALAELCNFKDGVIEAVREFGVEHGLEEEALELLRDQLEMDVEVEHEFEITVTIRGTAKSERLRDAEFLRSSINYLWLDAEIDSNWSDLEFDEPEIGNIEIGEA